MNLVEVTFWAALAAVMALLLVLHVCGDRR